jgi:hypothetical protein
VAGNGTRMGPERTFVVVLSILASGIDEEGGQVRSVKVAKASIRVKDLTTAFLSLVGNALNLNADSHQGGIAE